MLVAMASPIPFPLLTVLKRCHELESLMGQAYDALARAHAGHPRMSKLWAKTAKEEENHASQFSLAMSLGGDVMSSPKVDPKDMNRALHDAQAFLNEAKTSNLRLDDALRKAIKLEKQMAQFHLNLAVTFQSAAHEKLFRAMMASDKGHVSALQAELDYLVANAK
jgi:rubrerythrin